MVEYISLHALFNKVFDPDTNRLKTDTELNLSGNVIVNGTQPGVKPDGTVVLLNTDANGNLIVSPLGGSSTDVNVNDGLGNDITSTQVGTDRGLDVYVISGLDLRSSDNPSVEQVLVTDTATLIKAANNERISLNIRNRGTPTVHFGYTDSVTISDGFPLDTNEAFEWNQTNRYTGNVYGITSSGLSQVFYSEV